MTYLFIISLLLYGLRALHYHGLLKQENGFYGKYSTIFLKQNNYTAIFLGSSRAETQYHPLIFDSITGLRSYNIGLKGATPRLANMMLSLYLINSKTPDHVIYEVDYHYLKYRAEEIMEFNNFFPYLKYESVRKEFSKIDRRMEHFYLNPYYSFPYTGLKNLSTSLHGWLDLPNASDNDYVKGYLKVVQKRNSVLRKESPVYSFIDPVERNYIDSIISQCENKHIRLTFALSPLYANGKLSLTNKEEILRNLRNIATIHNIGIIDLSSADFSNDRTMFVDNNHLSYQGSLKYSLLFAETFNNKVLLKPLKP